MMHSVLIVGAGAAGLMAALDLSEHGYPVQILEAAGSCGGRIRTIRNSTFSRPVEASVEFIHGNLPLTMKMMQSAGIKYLQVGGKMVNAREGRWNVQEDFTSDWGELMKVMNQLREDVSLSHFLQEKFASERYKELRNSVLAFAEGFDLADPDKVSVLSLREEWMSEEEDQYRCVGGFDQLSNYLEKKCLENGCSIHKNTSVQKIEWKTGSVKIHAQGGKIFESDKIILTLPLGILQGSPDQKPLVEFSPRLPEHEFQFLKIGYGTVVKILLEFEEAFWKEKEKDLGFLFSNADIPTWWTQLPDDYPLLTGWAGGAKAEHLHGKKENEIIGLAMGELAKIFSRDEADLHKMLKASMVIDWTDDPFSRGGYSYNTIQSQAARNFLCHPVDDTVYFAGEALYSGPSPGTVEAALVSGREVAGKIMDLSRKPQG
jgi:monoamine oxidase